MFKGHKTIPTRLVGFCVSAHSHRTDCSDWAEYCMQQLFGHIWVQINDKQVVNGGLLFCLAEGGNPRVTPAGKERLEAHLSKC